MNGRKLGLIGLLVLAGLALVALLAAQPAGATVTGDIYSGYGDWNINNPTTVVDETIIIWDGNMTVNSRLTVWSSTIIWVPMFYWDEFDFNVRNSGSVQSNDSYFESWWYFDCYFDGTVNFDRCSFYYTYELNTTGTSDFNGTRFYYGPMGYHFMGPTDIDSCYFYYQNDISFSDDCDVDLSMFYYQSGGIYIDDDDVDITNTQFRYLNNKGLYLDNCDATLGNVSIMVSGGTYVHQISTSMQHDWENSLYSAIGLGLWVNGGNPSFKDVDVEADQYAEFQIDYTGTGANVQIYLRGLGAPVVIDTTEMPTVTGIRAHDSYFYMRARFSASNPGINPLRYEGIFYGYSAGIAIINYDDVTVTGVDVSNVEFRSLSLSVSGGSQSNSGWSSYMYRFKVTTAIVGDHPSGTDSMLTIRDMDISDGSLYFYMVYNPYYGGTGTPMLKNKVLIENVTVRYASGWDGVFRVEGRSAYDGRRDMVMDFDMTGCTFTGINGNVLTYDYQSGPGSDPAQLVVDMDEDIDINNCTVKDSQYDWTFFSIYGVWDNHIANDWDRKITLADNTFRDFWGVAFYAEGVGQFCPGDEELWVVNNQFINVSDGPWDWNGPFYTWEIQTIRFLDNEIRDTDYSETADFYDYGGDQNGVERVDWLFKGNHFDNCFNSRYSEIIFLEWGGDVVVQENEIENCDGFISFWHDSEYTGSSTLRVIDNKYHDNMAYMFEYGNVNEDQKVFTMTVRGNEVYRNEDFFINYWGSSATLDAFDYDGHFNIINNTFHNNTGGCLHIWGDVTIQDNDFFDNQGPLALIDYINLNVPSIANNKLAKNVDLFTFIAKDRGYQLVPMNLQGQTLSCTGTALYFRNMDVVMNDVDIIAATKAIVAYNTYVNAYRSTINGANCQVIGNGLITTWWSMEVKVTWGDKVGTDSGVPVVDPLVVFYDADGGYYASDYADSGGVLAPALYQQWAVDLGGLHSFTPYTVKAASAGVTGQTVAALNGDRVGVDAVHVLLWDTYEPVVAITEPYEGAVYASDSINALGFVAEVGSGLASVEYSADGGNTWSPLPTAVGDWGELVEGLSDGDVTITLRAKDIAGNSNTTSVVVTIDTSPPRLTLNTIDPITNTALIAITGVIEDGAELFINGVSYGHATSTSLSEDYQLHEGLNIIVVEAFDAAGNSEMASFQVTLDTHVPVLVLTGPADMMVTRMDTVKVTGIVEVGATLTINGEAVVPDATGTFSEDVGLAEGENNIVVTATDEATNAISVERMVYLDQTPPDVSITEPDDGTVTANSVIQVAIEADDDAILTLNGRRISDNVRTVLLLEGENTITVKATDPAGNTAIESITVTLDTRPPVLNIHMPMAMEVWTKDSTIDISGVATEATGVFVEGVAAVFDPATGVFTRENHQLSPGENNITVTATDGVNEVSAKLKVWMSTTPPNLVIDAVEPIIRTSSFTISGQTDPGIEMVDIEGYWGSTLGHEGSYQVNYDGSFDVTLTWANGGPYNVKVIVTNKYGNEASVTSEPFDIKARGFGSEDGEEGGLQVEPMELGLLFAVIGITLVCAAFVTAYAMTRRRPEE